ncbi:transposase [Salipiger pacificus]|uniref:Transposase n=1 Tax=Salipiger mangrovisoli TaxID=2865933 RepID=A0ABR9X7W8_9RHOB|nr:transposase [Salipiger mangrovisoli]
MRLMTLPGAGPVTAATFVATIDAPARFATSRSVAAFSRRGRPRLPHRDAAHGCRLGRGGRHRIDPARSPCGAYRVPRRSPGDVRALNAETKPLRG